MMTRLLVVFALLLVPLEIAHAQSKPAIPELRVALLLGASGAGDKGFNDAAIAGIDAARKHGRVAVSVRLAPKADAYDATIDRLAADRPDLIIGVGFLYADPFRTASARHPELRFLLLDVELTGASNVKSVTFRADEGSFLAGVAAAAESKRGHVGFIGGMHLPVIEAFECGYETGIRWAAKEMFRTVWGHAAYIGTTPEAFANPRDAAELTHTMVTKHGVDVVYAAAGSSGLGMIEAARAAKLKAIGVDADQRHVAPDTIVTSMRKRLDLAVAGAIADVRRKAFHGGVSVMTLANGGVDLVMPGRLTPATVKLVTKARAAILAGRAAPCEKVEDKPPAWNFPPRPSAP
jgi:basic membrane protein A